MSKRKRRRRREPIVPVPGLTTKKFVLGRRVPPHLRGGSSSLERPSEQRKVE
jgi:hypothetical protein